MFKEDKPMIKRTAILITMVFVFVTLTGVAFSADKKQVRDRKKDGSCQSYSIDHEARFIITGKQNRSRSGDQDRDRDRSQDGSCLDYKIDHDVGLVIAGKNGNGDQKRGQNRDGSCQDG